MTMEDITAVKLLAFLGIFMFVGLAFVFWNLVGLTKDKPDYIFPKDLFTRKELIQYGEECYANGYDDAVEDLKREDK